MPPHSLNCKFLIKTSKDSVIVPCSIFMIKDYLPLLIKNRSKNAIDKLSRDEILSLAHLKSQIGKTEWKAWQKLAKSITTTSITPRKNLDETPKEFGSSVPTMTFGRLDDSIVKLVFVKASSVRICNSSVTCTTKSNNNGRLETKVFDFTKVVVDKPSLQTFVDSYVLRCTTSSRNGCILLYSCSNTKCTLDICKESLKRNNLNIVQVFSVAQCNGKLTFIDRDAKSSIRVFSSSNDNSTVAVVDLQSVEACKGNSKIIFAIKEFLIALKGKQKHLPFRNSPLTFRLKNVLDPSCSTSPLFVTEITNNQQHDSILNRLAAQALTYSQSF